MKTAYRLTAIVACVMLVQASLGLMFRSAYRDVEWIASTWLGNDWVTLVVALPMLATSLRLTSAGRSRRAMLLWLGVLAYAVYNYAYYLLGAALNAFFPLYLAGVIAPALALIAALSAMSPDDVARHFHVRTPTRVIGGFFIVVGASLAAIWIAMWAAHVFAGQATPVEPEAFKLVAALDTVLMVPALVIGGALLWRRRAWGYVAAAVAGIQASLYLLVLAINSAIFIFRGLAASPGELPLWSGLAIATSTATAWLFSNVARQTEA